MAFTYTYPAAVMMVGVLIGCTSESLQGSDGRSASSTQSVSAAATNHAPTIQSIQILPTAVTLGRQISVQADAFDPDADLITYRHRWRVNGVVVPGETHSIFNGKALKRGDRLSVEVTPYDGNMEGMSVQVDALVGNAAPQVTEVLFEPAEVRVGDRIVLQAAGHDADQDPIEYRYRWWRNNSEVADGDVSELDTNDFVKGDTIVVEVTPSDPTSKGKSKISNPITILNSPPKITTVPPTKIERGRFIYAVSAKDPDGDQLAYTLEVAPPGMKIDKLTGRIEWLLTGKLTGNHKVRVTATDDEQARAFQEFDLTFSSQMNASRMTIPKNFRLNTRLVTPFPALVE
jgi:translation initiation factor IF-1